MSMNSAATPTYVNILVEGPIDNAVARRLLKEVELVAHNTYGQNGKDQLLQRLPQYNQAAQYTPWFALVDLDDDADCAPTLAKACLPIPSRCMYFRIAVRAVEAWLLADVERVAAFLGVARNKVPSNPDMLSNPKLTLINLARRSRRRQLREDLVPPINTSGLVGPGYTGRVIEFVQSKWKPQRARQNSGSLDRCLLALEMLHVQGC